MNLYRFCMPLLVFALISGGVGRSHAVTPAPFAQYGQIQNVQNHSSNPFWSPNSAYNQRGPQAVYVQGADLTAADCQQVVGALIASHCSMRNNCMDDSLDDIRPAITLQLAQMPNHNYVGSCAGYMDTEFDKYKQTHVGVIPNRPVAFPDAGTPVVEQPEFEIQNPYAPKAVPQWKQDMMQREQELKDLQAQNGSSDFKIVRAEFPTTIDDLSYSQRMENAAKGYEPFKDAVIYEGLKIEDEAKYLARMEEQADARQKIARLSMGKDEYCQKYPGDTEYCTGKAPTGSMNSPDRLALINKVVDILKNAQK